MHAQEMASPTHVSVDLPAEPQFTFRLFAPQHSRVPSASSGYGDTKSGSLQPGFETLESYGYIDPLSAFDTGLSQPLDDMSTENNSFYLTPPSPEFSCTSSSDNEEYIPDLERRKLKLAHRRRNRSLKVNKEAQKWTKEVKDGWDAYANYRSRSRQKRKRCKNPEDGPVWPDHVENAFMMAIQKVPKMGRCQLLLRGKLAGRNEFISEFIFRATGDVRCRKQISSHIQQLKKMLKHNQEFMACFVPPTPEEEENLKLNRHNTRFMNWDQALWDITPCSPSPSAKSEPTFSISHHQLRKHNRTLTSTSGMSLAETEYSSSGIDPSLSGFGTPCTDSLLIAEDHAYTKPQLYPSAFGMWVSKETDIPGQFDKCTHVYSSLFTNKSSLPLSVPLMSLPSWASRFPYVAELYENNHLNPECQLLHFTVTVSTMSTPPPPNSAICTQFELTVPIDYPMSNHYGEIRSWECVIRIYTSGSPVQRLSHIVPMTEDITSVPGNQKLTIPFATAEFWSPFYAGLAESHEASGSDVTGKKRKRAGRAEKAALKEVTVVQELFCSRSDGLHEVKERSALMLFEFGKCESGKQGSTTWRPLEVRVPSETYTATVHHPTPQPLTVHPSFLSIDRSPAIGSDWGCHSYNSSALSIALPDCGFSMHPYDSLPIAIMDSTPDFAFMGSEFSGYEPVYVADGEMLEYENQYREEMHIEMGAGVAQAQRAVSPGELFYQDPREAVFGMEEDSGYVSTGDEADGMKW